MITRTQTGVKVEGTLAREPEVKTLGTRDVLILNVKAESHKTDAGKWEGLYVDVRCWSGLTERDGMYQKGDYITATGRELKRHEYPEGSGKWYYNLDADGITPGDLVTLRWMQQVVDMIPDSPLQAPPVMAETDEDTPFDPPDVPPSDIPPAQQMYPGENLGDYAPRSRQPVPEDDLTAPLGDEDDLPF